MFRTKLEVDRHVESCLKKINNETERNLKGIAFARLYFNVGDFEQARRYVSAYLTVKPLSAEGLSLLGKTLEKQGKREAAIDAYRKSLDIDPKQNNLVLKVCELLASDDVGLDLTGARYFCEKAQSFDPHNPVVFNLKERLVAAESHDPSDVAQLLLTELASRPTDVHLRVRLLRHLLQNNQIKEAYKHASDIEQKNLPIFLNNLSWYETIAEVLVRYQRENMSGTNLTWEFWILLVSVLDKLVALTLDERSNNIKSSSECVLVVFNFDQTLAIAAKNVVNCTERSLVQEFLTHYRAQLCFHLMTLLFKQAKRDLLKYKEAMQMSLPLLFASYHAQPAELHCMWLDHSSETRRQQVQRWHREAAYRCSQSGHILLSTAKDRKVTIIEKTMQNCSGLWREQLFKKLFVTRDQQAKLKSSHFVSCPSLLDITVRLPVINDLVKYDEVAEVVYPDSLHHLIWICLNQKLAAFKCTVFDGLQYSVKHLNNCAAESLSVLDIEAFLYCATLTVQQQSEELKHQVYYNNDKPNVLPAAVTNQLGTLNQTKWFTAAYKMYRNEYGSDMSELRLNLIRGIEVVRCVGNHGLDVKLLVILANTFAERSKNLSKQSEIEFTEARADLYWKAALPILEKLQKNQAVTYAGNRLFEYRSKEMSPPEILAHIDEGKLFNATQLMKKKEYEKALNVLESLLSPYASFYQAQIYKAMADEQVNQNKENVTSEMRSQHIILLSRARDCLYLTLDRLRNPSVDRKHPLNTQLGTEIEKIERLLSRIDPDVYNHRNDCDGMSDENVSSAGSVGDHMNNIFSSTSFYPNESLTPQYDRTMHSNRYRLELPTRREARPSPERLDAQLRQMQASRDTTISHILEQNRIMVDSHRSLVDELRTFRDAVTNLATTVEELKTGSVKEEMNSIKESVNSLKSAFDELQNFQDVKDLVHEIKKEIADLKKDSNKSKNNQLSDEDLYVLDEEYGGDYGINSNVAAGFNPSNLYQNYQARLPAANSLTYPPAALYPGLYPMYPYTNLGLPQAGALPFGQETQMPDFRALSSLSQGLPQPAYGQSNLGQPGLAQPKPWDMGVVQPGLAQLGLVQAGLGQPGLPLPQAPQVSIFKDPKVDVAVPASSTGTTSLNLASTNIFSSVVSHAVSVTTSYTSPMNKVAPPVNVVITSSDPLPKTSVQTTQVLSVTIPPQHLKSNHPPKSQPHNYQIPLPTTGIPAFSTTPTIINQPPLIVSTQGLLSNIAPPVYSAIESKSPSRTGGGTGLGLQIEKSLSQSFNANDTSLNKSSSSVDEHDPCPDFKPIIPLPDEVPVNTGEENEKVLFCERAKLFRFTNKEWRERGVGSIKILQNRATGKIRILMRRDQVHKICANHFLTNDMVLTPMSNNGRAYVWAAHDYADEEMVVEKLCVRFKTEEEANAFRVAFEKAKSILSEAEEALSKVNPTVLTPKVAEPSAATLGGFIFITTPTFMPKDQTSPPKVAAQPEVQKSSSPFASFSFGSKNTPPTITATALFSTPTTSSVVEFKPVQTTTTEAITTTPQKSSQILASPKTPVEEFEPTVNFTPVIPLPELIDVKTGEENAEILFESRAKLLRYDSTNKEWKERGVGIMKILKENTIRLLMRREQVHKVCCNHQLFKTMQFTKMSNNPKALTWCAQDFSEGVFRTEMFAIRFKSEEQADAFYKAITSGQDLLDDGNVVKSDKMVAIPEIKAGTLNKSKSKEDKKVKSEPVEKTKPESSKSTTSSGWGDKFKTKLGSWECKNCYIINEGKAHLCIACETPKSNMSPKKLSSMGEPDKSGTQFSFGIPTSPVVSSDTPPSQQFSFGTPTINTVTISNDFLFGQKSTPSVSTNSWGDAFKPKEGSWECSQCLVRNDPEKLYCASCEGPKDDSVPPKKDTNNKGINLETPGVQFSFGIPKPSSGEVIKSTPSNAPQNISSSSSSASSWGDAFKPKEGSWECGQCFVRNDAGKLYCVSCEGPKDDSVPPKKDTNNKGINLETPGLQFSFGIPNPSSGDSIKSTPKNISSSSSSSSWGDAFKPKEGSWECGQCFVRNDAGKLYCASCEGPKDDSVTPKKETNKGINLETPGVHFNFGIPTGTTTSITKSSSATTISSSSSTTFGFTPQPTSTFTFGSVTVSSADSTTSPAVKPFTFGGTTAAPISKQQEPPTSNENRDQFVFGSPQKHTFEFTPRSPRRHSSGGGGGQGDEESDGFVEDEGDHIYFKPVIPLPDKIDVKTGEEQEEILYCHRAKLFRFVQGEWKERGIGDIKILLKTDSGRLRVLMRREQVLKICLNHILTADIEYLPKDDKTWLFSAPDFSEGEINHWQFCLRFKTADIAQDFKKAVDQALLKIATLSGGGGAAAGDAKYEPSTKDSDSDVEFVSETQVTPEEEQEAIRLKLPPKFMAYRQLPDCTCETCKKEDKILGIESPPTNKTSNSIFGGASSTFFGTPCKPSSFGLNTTTTTTSSSFLFGSPFKATTTTSFESSPTTLTKSESLKDMLMKPSVLGNIATSKTEKIFETTPVPPKNLFSTDEQKSAVLSPAMKNFSFTFKTDAATTTITPTPTTNIFAQAPAKPSSIFGGGAPSTVASVFSGTTTPSGSLFDNSNSGGGGSLFGYSNWSPATPGNIFGGGGGHLFGSQNIFNVGGDAAATKTTTIPTTTALWDTTKSTELVAKVEEPVKEKEEKKEEELVLKCDSNLSFASLAAAVTPAFKPTSTDEAKPFAFLGSGAPVFASLNKPSSKSNQKKKEKDQGESKDETSAEGGPDTSTTEHADATEEYDPHYEPIIPLPEAIVVSTGEEEEVPIFNERAKLYRFDNQTKEWKERGVGQMKILHHPVKGTYRFLLRREQVHKCVLNMLITPTIDLQPMTTSDKAWLWCGYNYSDNEGAIEKLAARFKNCDLAHQFHTAALQAIAAVKEQQEDKSLPSTIQNYGIVDVSDEHETSHDQGGDDNDDEDDDDDDEEEDDRSIMFMKHCNVSEQLPTGEWKDVGSGDVQVYYDSDIYGSRISIVDDTGLMLSNTLIGINTEMTVQDDNSCIWKAVEWTEVSPRWRTLKATFSDQESAEEFHCNYLESVQIAHESDLVDGILAENPDTDED